MKDYRDQRYRYSAVTPAVSTGNPNILRPVIKKIAAAAYTGLSASKNHLVNFLRVLVDNSRETHPFGVLLAFEYIAITTRYLNISMPHHKVRREEKISLGAKSPATRLLAAANASPVPR